MVEAKIVKLLEELKSNTTYKQKMSKDKLNNLFDAKFRNDRNAKGNLHNWKVCHVTQTFHEIRVPPALSVFI